MYGLLQLLSGYAVETLKSMASDHSNVGDVQLERRGFILVVLTYYFLLRLQLILKLDRSNYEMILYKRDDHLGIMEVR